MSVNNVHMKYTGVEF